MVHFLRVLTVMIVTLFLASCGGGGNSSSTTDTSTATPLPTAAVNPTPSPTATVEPTPTPTETVESTPTPSPTSVSYIGGTDTIVPNVPENPTGDGFATKGPFRTGSKVVAYQLDSDGTHTGRYAETNVTDDKGTFAIQIDWTGATEIIITGEYLDEDTGEYLSDGNLSAIFNMNGSGNKLGVNLLTTIAAGGAKKRMAAGEGIDEATGGASDDVKKLFNLGEGEKLELLNVVEEGAGNGLLLQFSASFTKMDNPAEVLDDIVQGMGTDGNLSEEGKAALDEVKKKAKEVDPAAVIEHLKAALGDDVDVPETLEQEGTLGWDHNISFDETHDAFLETVYVSNEVIVEGIVGESAAISIVGGRYSIDDQNFTESAGVIANGQKLKLEATSAAAYLQTVTATVTIGGMEIPYSVKTMADPFVADTKPERFSFGVQRKQPIGTEVISETITITGINTATPISIENGEYDINNSGTFTVADGVITPDSNVTVRHYSASEFSTWTKTIVTIGGVKGKFKSKTEAEDTKPEPFSFERQNDVAINSDIESNVVTITGINSPARIVITGGEYKVGNGDWTKEEGEIPNGFDLQVKHTSSTNYRTKKETIIIVGTRVAKFVSKTELDPEADADRVPEPFVFETQVDQNRSYEVESNPIVVSGVNRADVPISINYGEYKINDGAYTNTNGVVKAGDIITVRHTTSNKFRTAAISTLTIGGVRGKFKTVTELEDNEPDLFSFDENLSVPTDKGTLDSNEITISGINTEVTAEIVRGTGMIVKDGVDAGTSTTVVNGNKIKIRQPIPATEGTKAISTLKVGKVRASFVTRTVVSAPVLTGSPATTIAEGSRYLFQAENIGGEIETWSIANKPNWLVFNTRNGKLSGTPLNKDVGTYNTITITASNESSKDSIEFNLTVTNVNGAPTLEATPTTRVAQGTTYTAFTPTVIDDDAGDTHTFTIANNPSWMQINADTGEVSGSRELTNADMGTTQGIVITVTDSEGLTGTFTFDVTVTNTNDAPEISNAPATTVNEDSAYSFTPVVTDDDAGDTHTFTITNKPIWATFDTATGRLSGTPLNEHVGTTSDINITVTDGAGATNSVIFDLAVINVNDAPTIAGVPKASIDEGMSYPTFTPVVNDVDVGDTKRFEISGLPSWMSFDTSNGILSGTTNAVAGKYNLAITVFDSANASATLAFTLTVKNVNDVPVLSPISDLTIAEDTNGTVHLIGSDADGNETTFYKATTDIPKVKARLDGTTLTLIPALNYNGTTNVTVILSDGTLQDTKTFILTVTPVDDAPVLSPIPAQTIDEDGNVTIEVNATDVENDLITYTATSLNEEAATVSVNGSQVTIQAVKDYTGAVDINVTATANGLSDSQIVSVTITPLNDAPVMGIMPDVTLDEDTNLTIEINATDAEGATLSFEATSSNESLATVSVTGTQLTITPVADQNGDVNITLVANDGELSSDSLTFTAYITPVDDAPVLNTIAPLTLVEDSNITVELNASDIDSDTITYSAVSLTSSVLTVNVVDSTMTLTSINNILGVIDVNVTATADGQSDSQIVKVTITGVNDAPIMQSIADVTLEEDTNATVELNATDVDSVNLTYNATSSDETKATVSVVGTVLTIMPVADQNDDVNITVAANDGELSSDPVTFTAYITPVDDAPVLNTVQPISMLEDGTANVELNATDVDSDTINYSAVSANPALVTVNVTGNTMTVTAVADKFGSTEINVTATADGQSDSQIVGVTVTAVNDAPVLFPIDTQEMNEDDAPRIIELNATDVDNASVDFIATSDDTSKVTVSVSGNALTITPVANANGEVNVSVKAFDGDLYSQTETFLVRLGGVPDAPVLSVVDMPTKIEQDTTLSVQAVVTDADINDTEGEAETQTFTLSGNPAWMSVSDTGLVSGTPTNANIGITTDINLTVTDKDGLSDSFIFSIEVVDKNDIPTIEGTPEVNVSVGEHYSFIPTATDLDANTTLRFSIEGRPDWAEFNETTGELYGVPMFVDIGESDAITISVTDEMNTTSLDSFVITVSDDTNITALAVALPTALSSFGVDEKCADGNCSEIYTQTELLFGNDSKEYFTEYQLEANGTFQPNSGVFMSRTGWALESDGKEFKVNDNFMDYLDVNLRIAVTNVQDISAEERNISGLMVTMPTDAKLYTLNAREYGESYWLWDVREETSLDTFISNHCEQSFIVSKDGNGSTGLVMMGDGSRNCDDVNETGLLSEYDDTGTELNANAGFWVKKVVNGETVLVLYPTLPAYIHADEDENESMIFSEYDGKVWEGSETPHDGTPLIFEMYNDIATDAIKGKALDEVLGIVARFTQEMLSDIATAWSVHPESNETTGEHWFEGATWKFTATNLLAQRGLFDSVNPAEIDSTYSITDRGQLEFALPSSEMAYLTIVEDNRDNNMTLCWSSSSTELNCSEENIEVMYFDKTVAENVLAELNSSAVKFPDGYVYRVVNNLGEEKEDVVEGYTIKLFSNYQAQPNSQVNNRGVVVRVDNDENKESGLLDIHINYVGQSIIAALYNNGTLEFISAITTVTEDTDATGDDDIFYVNVNLSNP